MKKSNFGVSYYGNSSISLFFRANDKFVLAPWSLTEGLRKTVETRLNVPVVNFSSVSTDLFGLYTVMNNKGLVMGGGFSNEEQADISNFVRGFGMNVYFSDDVYNANGNNVCANDNGGIINPDIPRDEVKRMSETLGVELVPLDVAGYKTVGSMCCATNKGFVCHNDSDIALVKELKEIFKVNGINGTVNMGVPFAGIGIVANSFGYVIGSESSGVEVNRVEDALGLIK